VLLLQQLQQQRLQQEQLQQRQEQQLQEQKEQLLKQQKEKLLKQQKEQMLKQQQEQQMLKQQQEQMLKQQQEQMLKQQQEQMLKQQQEQMLKQQQEQMLKQQEQLLKQQQEQWLKQHMLKQQQEQVLKQQQEQILKQQQEQILKQQEQLLKQQQQQQQEEEKNNKEKPSRKKDVSENKKHWSDDEFEVLWQCQLCGNENTASLQNCQSCNQSQNYQKNNAEPLTFQKIINNKMWKPCEEQEYGWILQNNSKTPLKINAKLTRFKDIGNDIVICEEGMLLTYESKQNGQVHVIVNARAPMFCGEYTTSWKLTTNDNRQIGPILEMKLVVKSELKVKQEEKVKQIICDFGFKDRDLVVVALSATNWDIGRATQMLFDQSNAK